MSDFFLFRYNTFTTDPVIIILCSLYSSHDFYFNFDNIIIVIYNSSIWLSRSLKRRNSDGTYVIIIKYYASRKYLIFMSTRSATFDLFLFLSRIELCYVNLKKKDTFDQNEKCAK